MQTTVKKPEFTVVKPQTSITTANAYLLEGQLTATLKQKHHSILLIDLERVEFIDSAGLMVLISSCKLAQSNGIRLCICSILPSLKIIIELTQLDLVFEIFDCQAKFTQTL